jgi:hypothetical protein
MTSTFAFTDLLTYVAGYEFTTDMNESTLDAPFEELDRTVFGNTAKQRKAGLEDIESKLTGLGDFDDDAVDEQAFNQLTGLQTITQIPRGAAGDTAFLYQARSLSYQTFGKIGELVPFEVGLKGGKTNGSAGLVRGQLAKVRAAVSGTGQLGSVLNLGAPAAGQSVYWTVHALAAGTTVTVKLQSDDAAAFSSPTDRDTATITTAGGTWKKFAAGALSGEAYWRLTVSAITGTFTLAAAIGIK